MYPYVRPYWFRALMAILITIPVGSMDAVIAWSLKPYMDVVLIEKSVRSAAYVPLLIIIFSLTQSFLNYGATYLNGWVGRRITNDLKDDLYKKLLKNDVAFFDKTTSGDIQIRFNGDAETACSGLINNVKVFATRFFSSVALIGVLLYNSWQLSIVALIFMFAAFVPLGKIRKKIKHLTLQSITAGGNMATQYNEAFSGNRVIASYNLHEKQQREFAENQKRIFKLSMKMIQRTGIVSPMMHFLISSGIAGVVWFGSYLIVTGQMTGGNFVSFIAALLMLYTPIKTIGNSYNALQTSFLAMERVFAILDKVPTITNAPDAKPLDKIKKDIKFKNVSFEYLSGKPVLKNINIDIPVGHMIALVGNSGGGKTTFVNLLPRFYDVTAGEISIDGTNIKNLDLYSLRDKIAIVFQDNFLFTGTIRDNILLGKENATEEELNAAIEASCLREFIDSLEEGVDTHIGERGVLLSGGQKQRIGIARAFIKNAPIVILDEATSALDNKSEAVVQQAIDNLMKDRTVFVIAHRLSTVRNADKIIVINQGEIAETGSHKELLAKENGIYKSLYDTQLKI
ncbi:MAG: ABC transporter ATP-binding protein [Alphaproteobacteria bacterium]|nr:ABC transporter ATP-binding protein [Alphaproteobacteria bacterium]